MEEKYYSPSIEEFYIGFEYEINSMAKSIEEGGPKGKDIWMKETFGDEFVSFIGTQKSLSLWARVKYLDREDIESLGWIWTGQDGCFDYVGYSNKEGYEIQSWGDNNYSIEKLPLSEHKTIHFVGIIKNKSELKKLLQQLNIQK